MNRTFRSFRYLHAFNNQRKPTPESKLLCAKSHFVSYLNNFHINIKYQTMGDTNTKIAPPPDERNVEIKAHIPGGIEEFEKRMEIAKKLTQSEGKILLQRDVFFTSPLGGRLKLRYLEKPARSQLVYYKRPDVTGPKISKYNTIEIDEPEMLEKILSQTNGSPGVLAKKRYLFIYEQTRIHLDDVQNLGYHMEFEVCLKPEQTLEEGESIANQLKETFLIQDSDLMSGSYFEALEKD